MKYSGKTTNMKANSSGSVTPVRKAVSAAAERMPTATFFCFLFAPWIMASAAAGHPEKQIGGHPRREDACRGVACGEAGEFTGDDVAVGGLIIAVDEPDVRVR